MDEKSEQLKRERALLVKIQSGDPKAWAGIYDLHAPRLYRCILMPRLANPTAAEDALADTFRTAMERLDQYEEQAAGMFPWLARIAHNKAMDLHRGRATSTRKLCDLAQALTPLLEPVPGADDLLSLRSDAHTLSRRMQQALEELNPRYRRAIELRLLEEKSRKECAELLEVKVGTLDVLVLRAVRALRKNWDALNSEVGDG